MMMKRFIAGRNFFFRLVVNLFLCICLTCPIAAQPEEKQDIWQQAQQTFKQGNISETIVLLRNCRAAGQNAYEAEVLLKDILASQSIQIREEQELGQLSLDRLDELYAVHEEISSFEIATPADWKKFLQVAAAYNEPEPLIVAGQKFLDLIRKLGEYEFDNEWVAILKKLSKMYDQDWQIIYRWQIHKILATLPQTKKDFSEEFIKVSRLAQVRVKAIIGLAAVAIAIGDLQKAAAHLEQVKFFNPDFPGLHKMFVRLKRARKIQSLLNKSRNALQSRDFANAVRYAEEVFKIDKNNIFARGLQKEIEEAKQRKLSKSLTDADRILLKLRKLNAELRKAQANEDLLKMRSIYKEMLLYSADGKLIRALEEVETLIVNSQLKAEERFAQAQELFANQKYDELRLFLNRNPGMMSSVERMVEIWEMKLMVNFDSGDSGPIELRNSALNILQNTDKSFYASFILMKLDMAENNMDEARKHYQDAFAIKPKFPGLRWPGWLLWMHGPGRPVVVIVLIVGLLLMIRLIRPVIAWYESTYWTRVSLLAKVFPSLALRSLEKCFGLVKDKQGRIKLFRLLVKCGEKTGKKEKTIKYAENLLELIPGDEVAIRAIGASLLRLPEVKQEKMPLLIKYALLNKDNAKIIEKTGSFVKRSKQIRVEQIDFLKIYAQKFPRDENMFALIGSCLLEVPASELPDSAITLLEVAWKATDSDELWWNLWRTLMCKGKFESAIALSEEALRRNKPILVDKLIEVYDHEQYGQANLFADELNSFDQKVVLKAAQSILTIKYVSQQMYDLLASTLEHLVHEENHDVAQTARQAMDHLTARRRIAEKAVNKLLCLSSDAAMQEQLPEEDLPPQPENEFVAGNENTEPEVPAAEMPSPDASSQEEQEPQDWPLATDFAEQPDSGELPEQPAEFAEPKEAATEVADESVGLFDALTSEEDKAEIQDDSPADSVVEQDEEQDEEEPKTELAEADESAETFTDPDNEFENEEEEFADEVQARRFDDSDELDEADFVGSDEATEEQGSAIIEKPEDYSDYLLGPEPETDKTEKSAKVECPTFENIPEYTIDEVDPEELKDVISGQALPNGEEGSRIKERRKEIFAGLDEIAAPEEVSDGWRQYLQRETSLDLFAELKD